MEAIKLINIFQKQFSLNIHYLNSAIGCTEAVLQNINDFHRIGLVWVKTDDAQELNRIKMYYNSFLVICGERKKKKQKRYICVWSCIGSLRSLKPSCMWGSVHLTLTFHSLYVSLCGSLGCLYELNLRYPSCFRMDTGFKTSLFYSVKGKNGISYNNKKKYEGGVIFFICYPKRKESTVNNGKVTNVDY